MAKARRGCGYVEYEPIPTCLSISGNTLIYETNTGEVKNVQLPQPFSGVTFNPANCILSYENDVGTITNLDLSDILLKSQDSLIFDETQCTLKYTSVTGDCQLWNIGAAIFDKLKDSSAWNPANCVLSLTDTSGSTINHDLSAVVDKVETDLNWDPENCILTFTGPTGADKFFNLTEILDKLCIFTDLEFDPATCVLKFTNPAGQCSVWDLGAALANKDADKCYEHVYDTATHTVSLIETTSGNTVSTTVLNCGSLAWDGDNCRLLYTDEKNNTSAVPLPIGLQGCVWAPNNRNLTFTDAKGNTVTKNLGTDSFTVNIGAGTFTHVDVSGQPVTVDVCQLAEKCKPSMTVSEGDGGAKTFCFSDGYGTTTCCDIPAVELDIDNMVVNGSTVTFTTGGDGNPGVVVFDVCAMVAQNCNAHFSSINPDGSWTFIDNAGNTYNWAPIVTTLVDNGNTFTYISENGTVTTVDKCCTNITEDADSYFITDHEGNVAEVCKRPVKDVIFNGVAYQPDASGSVVFNYEAPESASDTLSLNLPGVGGGLGTATITQTDGTVKDDVVCGVQSTVVDNGDGTATMTQNDGSVCDIQKPLEDKNGDPVVSGEVLQSSSFNNANRPIGVTGDQILGLNANGLCRIFEPAEIPEAADPIVLTGVDGEPISPQADGSFCVTPGTEKCIVTSNDCYAATFNREPIEKGDTLLTDESVVCSDGMMTVCKTQFGVRNRFYSWGTGVSEFPITAETAVETVVMEGSMVVPTTCPTNAILSGQAQMQAPIESDNLGGLVQVAVEYRWNGGAWVNQVNGAHAKRNLASNDDTDWGISGQANLPACTDNLIEIRFVVKFNSLSANEILNYHTSNLFAYVQELCHRTATFAA